MTKIWKYPITPEESSGYGNFEVSIPTPARVLVIRLQGTVPYMWVEIDTDRKKIPRKFRIFGTGEDIRPSMSYLGTYQIDSDVYHVFEDNRTKGTSPRR